MPHRILLVHSHQDKRWLEKLKVHLTPLTKAGDVLAMNDSVFTGEASRTELKQAFNNARVVLVLLSSDLLASEIMASGELESNLEAAAREGALVGLVALRPSMYDRTFLAHFQAVTDPSKPLAHLTAAGRELEFLNIAKWISSALERTPHEIKRPRPVTFSVELGDILKFEADVAIFKYAQNFYGADEAAATALQGVGTDRSELVSKVGGYRFVETKGGLSAKRALFLGVADLLEFGYEEIREFSSRALRVLAAEAPETRVVTVTAHGAGYGLDEEEAFFSLLAGLLQATRAGEAPPALERIIVVERHASRAAMFRSSLENAMADATRAARDRISGARRGAWRQREPATPLDELAESSPLATAGKQSVGKPHIFVAMPFRKDMYDVFYYGIQAPARAAGFLCERIDQEVFTGDILERVKAKIETAALVVAELTGANANVYLEVGYAWGKGRPTVLVAKSEEKLLFDVRGQRCLTYEIIKDLEDALTRELLQIKEQLNL
jgi:hypothetical protein